MSSQPRHQRASRLSKFLFGAPYYPEHWGAEERREDAARMAAAGMNVVRLAEFAWDLIEPARGEYDFSLFDETIAELGRTGIDTILCTPTAAPPRWLTLEHPEWMRINGEGQSMHHGSRQHVCTTQAGFRGESERITRAMAEHYRDNPHVIGWQTDNEFHCHISECFCPACVAGFQAWLRTKYGSIEVLNTVWGTAFWALTYSRFDQIEPPRNGRPTFPNPGAMLDWYRFLSDSLCEFQRGQVQALREVQPSWWITHNGTFHHIDFWKFTEDLDFLGVDVYPGFAVYNPPDFWWAAMKNEEARSASGSYIIPEQQSGAGGQFPYLLRTPDPGEMRLWAWQAAAHGADGILHFRWRTCRFGAEIYWNGILDHDNVPRRRYREFCQEGEEFRRLGDRVLGTVLSVKAAILADTDQDDAHQTMPMGLPSPEDQRRNAYRQMLQRKLPCGLVNARDSFDGLQLIYLPSFVLMDEDLAARLEAFVRDGGVLVATARTATRYRNNQMMDRTPPGFLREVFGISVEEFGKMENRPLDILTTGGGVIPMGPGYEILKPDRAEVLGRWDASRYAAPHAATGEPAISMNRLGKGAAIFVGTYLIPENSVAIWDLILAHAEVAPLAEAAECVEVTCRHAPDRRLYFLLNHYGLPQQVAGLPRGRELLSGRDCRGGWYLDPYGVAVVEVTQA